MGEIATGFVPSRHGFGFVNSWPDQPALRLPTPWGPLGLGNAAGGLCGGMVFAAADYYHAGRTPPRRRPGSDDPLYRYLVRRLLDSWRLPPGVGRYYQWMLRTDTAVAWRTWDVEWPALAAQLRRGRVVPLGVVTVSGADPRQLPYNHQVLAYGAVEGPDTVLRVYDPNRGPDDGVTITLPRSPGEPFAHTLGITRPVRGVFRVGYAPRRPPG